MVSSANSPIGEFLSAAQGTGVDVSLCRKRAVRWVLLGSIRQIIPQIGGGEAGVGECPFLVASPNYWGYHLQQIRESAPTSPKTSHFTNRNSYSNPFRLISNTPPKSGLVGYLHIFSHIWDLSGVFKYMGDGMINKGLLRPSDSATGSANVCADQDHDWHGFGHWLLREKGTSINHVLKTIKNLSLQEVFRDQIARFPQISAQSRASFTKGIWCHITCSNICGFWLWYNMSKHSWLTLEQTDNRCNVVEMLPNWNQTSFLRSASLLPRFTKNPRYYPLLLGKVWFMFLRYNALCFCSNPNVPSQHCHTWRIFPFHTNTVDGR